MDRSQIKKRLVKALEQATRSTIPDVDESANLQTGLGLDSLGLVSLMVEVQDLLDVAIELEEVQGVATVGELLDLLQAKLDLAAAKKTA